MTWGSNPQPGEPEGPETSAWTTGERVFLGAMVLLAFVCALARLLGAE